MKRISRRRFLEVASVGAAIASTGFLTARLSAESSEVLPVKLGPHRESFSFLHTYEATGRYWAALEKSGLLRPSNGIRLVNSPWGEDEYRFNMVARIGGLLHQLLQQRKCCFIVDRVVGGSIYNPYKFDVSLVDQYASMLGHKFLGGQVHETISNIHNDWGRFKAANEKFASQPVVPDEVKAYFESNDAAHKLEYGTLEEYAGRVHYNSPETLWNELRWAAKKESDRFGSHFSYCEGSGYGELAWHAFYKYGAAYGLAEVGVWASNQSQFAVASLRGSAKAAGKPWGVFFAPWGPNGCTSFIAIQDISWRCGEEFLTNTQWPAGPQFGFSSALQRRIFFHSFLSGAHTLHEEWGAEDNLLDWDEGKLSSYGKATKEFLDFQDAHPDVGVPYTPIALVLDAAVPLPDAGPWATLKEKLFRYSAVDQANAARGNLGNAEVACYAPCALPEVFDIVPSDAPASLWATYKEIIPVGTAPAPAGAAACPPEQVYDRLAAAVARLSPLARSTHLLMQINRRASDGAWIVGLYNPWGAWRGDVDGLGSVLDEGCAIQDTLRPAFAVKSVRAIYAWPNTSVASLNGNDIQATVGAGGVLILEILEKAERGAGIPARTLLVDPFRQAAAVAPVEVPVLSCRETYAEKLRAALTRSVFDENQQPHAVLLPVAEWERVVEELEELDDMRAYDEAKDDPGTPSLLSKLCARSKKDEAREPYGRNPAFCAKAVGQG